MKQRLYCNWLSEAMTRGCTAMNLQAKVKTLPRSKEFKIVPSAVKEMLTLFWGFNGPILEQYQDRGESVSSVRNCAMVEEEL